MIEGRGVNPFQSGSSYGVMESYGLSVTGYTWNYKKGLG